MGLRAQLLFSPESAEIVDSINRRLREEALAPRQLKSQPHITLATALHGELDPLRTSLAELCEFFPFEVEATTFGLFDKPRGSALYLHCRPNGCLRKVHTRVYQLLSAQSAMRDHHSPELWIPHAAAATHLAKTIRDQALNWCLQHVKLPLLLSVISLELTQVEIGVPFYAAGSLL